MRYTFFTQILFGKKNLKNVTQINYLAIKPYGIPAWGSQGPFRGSHGVYGNTRSFQACFREFPGAFQKVIGRGLEGLLGFHGVFKGFSEALQGVSRMSQRVSRGIIRSQRRFRGSRAFHGVPGGLRGVPESCNVRG